MDIDTEVDALIDRLGEFTNLISRPSTHEDQLAAINRVIRQAETIRNGLTNFAFVDLAN